MQAPHSLLWRLLPWLFPPLLIVVGLIFVISSLTGNDEPADVVAPPNVREISTNYAAPWAQRQVEPGVSSAVIAVILARAEASTPTKYTVRVVVTRVDTPADMVTDATSGTSVDQRIRTIVTCVRWQVDVRSGTIVEHGATQLSNDAGKRPPGDPGTLSNRCRDATFAY